ncbi:MAG: hypothetical protein M1828_001645 [Chrysothrix sp. TS-e1954]|nr:MAG: hypothetical protein M1828_001645 [Chrysothrix sp. TS-e1954]
MQSLRYIRHTRPLSSFAQPVPRSIARPLLQPSLQTRPLPNVTRRPLATRSTVDEKIEEIQEQYATAKDEFEIASEETEKNTTYAEDDRQAAREELDKLHAAYKETIEGPDQEMGEQIRQRVGQRIRELDAAVKNMEEVAMNQD